MHLTQCFPPTSKLLKRGIPSKNIAFSILHKTLLLCNGRIIYLLRDDGECREIRDAHSCDVTTITTSGDYCASGDCKGMVSVWNMLTLKVIIKHDNMFGAGASISQICFGNNVLLIAAVNGFNSFVGLRGNGIEEGLLTSRLGPLSGPIKSCYDCCLLESGDSNDIFYSAVVSDDHSLTIYSSPKGKVPNFTLLKSFPNAHDGFATCCLISEDGYIITGGGDGMGSLYSIEKMVKVYQFKIGDASVLGMLLFRSLLITSSQRQIAFHQLEGEKVNLIKEILLKEDILTLIKASNESIIAQGLSGTLYYISIESGSIFNEIPFHTGSITSLSGPLKNDGSLISCCKGGKAIKWLNRKGTSFTTSCPHEPTVIGDDVCYSDGNVVYFKSKKIFIEKVIKILEPNYLLTTAGYLYTVHFDGNATLTFNFSLVCSPIIEDGFIFALSIKYLIIFNIKEGTSKEFSLEEEGKILGKGTAIAFSSRKSLLAIGDDRRKITIFSLTENIFYHTNWSNHTSAISALAFSPSGEIICSGGKDNAIGIWSSYKERPIHFIRGAHSDPISGVKFIDDDGDGSRLISWGLDSTIREWGL